MKRVPGDESRLSPDALRMRTAIERRLFRVDLRETSGRRRIVVVRVDGEHTRRWRRWLCALAGVLAVVLALLATRLGSCSPMP
jgi:hypothetical protein